MRTGSRMVARIPDRTQLRSKQLSLYHRFTMLQREMVSVGMELGLHHPKILELSQQLDLLHNQLNRLTQRTRNIRKRGMNHYVIHND